MGGATTGPTQRRQSLDGVVKIPCAIESREDKLFLAHRVHQPLLEILIVDLGEVAATVYLLFRQPLAYLAGEEAFLQSALGDYLA